MRRSLLLASALLVGLLIGPPPPVDAGAQDRLAAAGKRSCKSVTPRAMQEYAHIIEEGLTPADKDVRANGTDGEYAVAATNSYNLLDRAMKRILAGKSRLERSDPRVTTSAEGGMVKEHVRQSLDLLSEAGHWALISAIYHTSTHARDTFEMTIDALIEGQELFAESGRCYMSGHL